MKPEVIRKVFATRPFRPLEILLDNGERLVVSHPESVLVGESLVAVMATGEQDPVILAPAAVRAVRPAKSGRSAKPRS